MKDTPPRASAIAKENRVAYAQRMIKVSPMLVRRKNKSKEQEREERRDTILKGVKDRREDQRWEAKETQILRDKWVRDRREWERRMGREAPAEIVEMADGEGELVCEQLIEQDLKLMRNI